jgi:hypothetical protein
MGGLSGAYLAEQCHHGDAPMWFRWMGISCPVTSAHKNACRSPCKISIVAVSILTKIGMCHQNYPMSNFMKIHSEVLQLLRENRQTDMAKLTGTLFETFSFKHARKHKYTLFISSSGYVFEDLEFILMQRTLQFDLRVITFIVLV